MNSMERRRRGEYNAETLGSGGAETRRRGGAETRRRGDAETGRRGGMETRRRGDAETHEDADGNRTRGRAGGTRTSMVAIRSLRVFRRLMNDYPRCSFLNDLLVALQGPIFSRKSGS
jgi:hypothetical protein